MLYCGFNHRGARPKVALFLGAGFSKSWGLPLASEVLNMESVREEVFPGKWQRGLLREIKSVWNATADRHKKEVDEFGRILHGSELFAKFVSFLALRLSSEHWRVGKARETKWGAGDHIRKQKIIPTGYHEFLSAFNGVQLLGIVTTNYDIVIEKLLGPRSSGRLGGFNYGMPGEHLVGRHAVSSQWSYGPVTMTGAIPLLKLNGSLNWAISRNGELVKYIDCRPSRGRRYRVLLFPPAHGELVEKLKPMRDHAHKVLRNAEIWVVYGYSIPDYDLEVRKLLQSSAALVSKVVIFDVNPRPVCEKLSAMLKEANRRARIEVGPTIRRNADLFATKKLRNVMIGDNRKNKGLHLKGSSHS